MAEAPPRDVAQPAIVDLLRAAADTPTAARAWLLDAAASLAVPVEFQPGRASVVAVDVEDEPAGPGVDGRRSVRLFTDLPSLGPVEVTVQLQANSIGTNFVVGDQAAAQLVRAHQGDLEGALTNAGWTRASVRVATDAAHLARRRDRTATPAIGSTSRPGRLVSLRA